MHRHAILRTKGLLEHRGRGLAAPRELADGERALHVLAHEGARQAGDVSAAGRAALQHDSLASGLAEAAQGLHAVQLERGHALAPRAHRQVQEGLGDGRAGGVDRPPGARRGVNELGQVHVKAGERRGRAGSHGVGAREQRHALEGAFLRADAALLAGTGGHQGEDLAAGEGRAVRKRHRLAAHAADGHEGARRLSQKRLQLGATQLRQPHAGQKRGAQGRLLYRRLVLPRHGIRPHCTSVVPPVTQNPLNVLKT